MSDVTHILQAVSCGDSRAIEELLPLVYGELSPDISHLRVIFKTYSRSADLQSA